MKTANYFWQSDSMYLDFNSKRKSVIWQHKQSRSEIVLFKNPKIDYDQFHKLKSETRWRNEAIRIYGKEVMQPRLIAWYGDQNVSYTYSRKKFTTEDRGPIFIRRITNEISNYFNHPFNFVLLNYYRKGQDYMGLHRDNEKELGKRPDIVTLSLGAKRCFQLYQKKNRKLLDEITVEHGDLLIMTGDTQQMLLHGIKKTSKPVGERISLTFRYIL